ncbi:MAG: DegT/DnrJ/EryC1/StrS family aminotransferase, partial [bacterium]
MTVEKPAIEGGTPVRVETLPYATQWIRQDEIDAVVETLKSTWITTGPREKEFSEEFAKYVGAEHAIAVNSCTSALNLSVAVLGTGPGDEVITTPMTFVATVFAIIHSGATPVFADIREDTFNIDPDRIEGKITGRTKAILPMHYGGNPVDLDPVHEIAGKHGLKVIEDAAHAAGAEYKGRKIGAISDLTCFSFHAIKNMTCAEGGMITTADAETAARLKALSFFGISQDAYKRSASPRPWHYDVGEFGFKYNMTDIAAAMGLVQLRRL